MLTYFFIFIILYFFTIFFFLLLYYFIHHQLICLKVWRNFQIFFSSFFGFSFIMMEHNHFLFSFFCCRFNWMFFVWINLWIGLDFFDFAHFPFRWDWVSAQCKLMKGLMTSWSKGNCFIATGNWNCIFSYKWIILDGKSKKKIAISYWANAKEWICLQNEQIMMCVFIHNILFFFSENFRWIFDLFLCVILWGTPVLTLNCLSHAIKEKKFWRKIVSFFF